MTYATAYVGTTGAVQILGAIATFAYVRFLTVDEYGKLGLALTTIAFIALMSDLGLTGALNYFKRESNRSLVVFEQKVAAIKFLRTRFFIIAAIIGVASISWSLWVRSTSLFAISGVAILVVGVAIAQLNLSLNQSIIRLSGDFARAYKADITGAVARLVLAMIVILIAPPNVSFVLISILLGTVAALAMTRRGTQVQHEAAQPESVRKVIRFILPMTPSVILLATQEMIIYFAAWWFGGAGPVASVFALGRISALLTILGGFFNVVVVSKLAGVTSTRRTLIGGYAFVSLLAATCSAAILAAWFFPDQILLLIGKDYAHLQTALMLSFFSASLTMLAQAVGQLNRIIGWVKGEPFASGIHFAAIVFFVSQSDLSTTTGVLHLWITINVVYLALNLTTTLIGVCAPNLLSLGILAQSQPSDHKPNAKDDQ